MGVLNITPDSFSDGGRFTSLDAALAQASKLIAEGASIIDVGGESTRPGATRLTPDAEQARVLPVIQTLMTLPKVASGAVAISIDTLNSTTAALAVRAGATIVNDVSGGQADPLMFETVANLQSAGLSVFYVLGHWANFEAGAGAVQETEDIVESVRQELAERVQLAEVAGISRAQIVIDPGLGFGKDSDQNLRLLESFGALASLELPILIGASRKRFLAAQIAVANSIELTEVTVEQRDAATASLSARLWGHVLDSKKADLLWGFRVHNVHANLDALQAASALRFAR